MQSMEINKIKDAKNKIIRPSRAYEVHEMLTTMKGFVWAAQNCLIYSIWKCWFRNASPPPIFSFVYYNYTFLTCLVRNRFVLYWEVIGSSACALGLGSFRTGSSTSAQRWAQAGHWETEITACCRFGSYDAQFRAFFRSTCRGKNLLVNNLPSAQFNQLQCSYCWYGTQSLVPYVRIYVHISLVSMSSESKGLLGL